MRASGWFFFCSNPQNFRPPARPRLPDTRQRSDTPMRGKSRSEIEWTKKDTGLQHALCPNYTNRHRCTLIIGRPDSAMQCLTRTDTGFCRLERARSAEQRGPRVRTAPQHKRFWGACRPSVFPQLGRGVWTLEIIAVAFYLVGRRLHRISLDSEHEVQKQSFYCIFVLHPVQHSDLASEAKMKPGNRENSGEG